MGFFSDLGTFGKDIFTGRWTGGETNVVQDVKNDPWVLAAPAALAAAPFVAPAIGGALGIGAGVEAAGIGAADAAGAGAADLATSTAPDLFGAFGGGGATTALGGSALPAEAFDPSVTSAFASADTAAGTTEAAPSWLTGAQATPATGTAFGGAPAGASGGPSWLSTLTDPSKWTLGGVAQGVGAAAALGGLGANLMKGNAAPEAQDRLSNVAAFDTQQAGILAQESTQLRSYLEQGTLPIWAQAQIKQLVNARKAAAISNAAKTGGNTDPTSNTALATDLANIDDQSLILAGQVEQQLFTAGQQMMDSALKAGSFSADALKTILGQEQSTMNNITQSIAAFAGALAGGGKGLSLKLQ